ncbi:MAG TPA: mandelate racemase/muconate lactonizing enzyme family protein [Rhizomicrobium sp.]|jgi:L-alanine-DL-glutamate epimerase-like enolase superfamily enzyme|nr:mandelate racemase/muconate lactonizing enzyme family protein [Rhizomicrobium sp.]
MQHDSTADHSSRRSFLRGGALGLAGAAAATATGVNLAAAAESNSVRIKDIQTMTVSGPRTYVLVRVVTNDGRFGIGEAYGTPGVAVAEQIMAIKPQLVGLNPLEIDKIYTFMGSGARSLAGPRTDGSAHMLMRAASGIEMALWDLAGRILNTPTSVLLGGQFRDHVRVYDHSRPRDMFDKAACREWADKVRAHPSGFTAHKIDVPRTAGAWADNRRPGAVIDYAHDIANRQLTTKELVRVVQAYENCREAIGWDHDIMVHCHWQYDLNTALELARAVAPIKPLWLEDPLQVAYTDSWKRLTAESPVSILTGENLERVEGFVPFLINQGCHIANPDLRNSGGFLESKRIADFASVFGIPITTHGTASQLYTYQVCQWAASIRDYMIGETITGEGGWMDQLLLLDGPYIEKGYVKVSNRPGTGAVLNPDVVKAHLLPGQSWWGDL